MSSSERLALVAISSWRPLMLVLLPLLSAAKTLEDPATTTVPRDTGAAAPVASCASTVFTWLRLRYTPFSLSLPTPALFTAIVYGTADAQAASGVAAVGIGGDAADGAGLDVGDRDFGACDGLAVGADDLAADAGGGALRESGSGGECNGQAEGELREPHVAAIDHFMNPEEVEGAFAVLHPIPG